MFTQRRLQAYTNERLNDLDYCIRNPTRSPYPPEWIAGYRQALEDVVGANLTSFKRTIK